MKCLVISDTHGITTEFFQVISDYKDDVDYIFHCGDSELSSHDTVWTMIDGVVKGNMDFDSGYHNEHIHQINKESSIFVTHGHYVGVNHSRQQLSYVAKEKGCQIALYGHTHILCDEKINGVICINPGSFNHSRGFINERTYAIVTIESQICTIDYYTHKKEPLSHLQKIYTLEDRL